MIWSLFKTACRLYSGLFAVVLLFVLLGQALTGGVRISPDSGHVMAGTDAAAMILWLLAVAITAATSSEEA